jgi:hypothetical protein
MQFNNGPEERNTFLKTLKISMKKSKSCAQKHKTNFIHPLGGFHYNAIHSANQPG